MAVVEERHFGRAAVRLHMTQPPLSRAVNQLEADLGAVLLHRSASGVTLTPAGALLYEEARTLLEHAEQARARVAAAGRPRLTIGTIADSAEEAGSRLVAAPGRQVGNPATASYLFHLLAPPPGFQTVMIPQAGIPVRSSPLARRLGVQYSLGTPDT